MTGAPNELQSFPKKMRRPRTALSAVKFRCTKKELFGAALFLHTIKTTRFTGGLDSCRTPVRSYPLSVMFSYCLIGSYPGSLHTTKRA